jgi:hypothetical protein
MTAIFELPDPHPDLDMTLIRFWFAHAPGFNRYAVFVDGMWREG